MFEKLNSYMLFERDLRRNDYELLFPSIIVRCIFLVFCGSYFTIQFDFSVYSFRGIIIFRSRTDFENNLRVGDTWNIAYYQCIHNGVITAVLLTQDAHADIDFTILNGFTSKYFVRNITIILGQT